MFKSCLLAVVTLLSFFSSFALAEWPQSTGAQLNTLTWEEVGAFPMPGWAQGVAINGTVAYVANYDRGLRSIDVGDPTAPFELGLTDTTGFSEEVVVSSTHAFVADWNSGMKVFQTDNNGMMVNVANHETSGLEAEITLAGTTALLCDYDLKFLRLIDVTNPNLPQEMGNVQISEAPYAVVTSGQYAFVAAGSGGLQVVDITNPYLPVVVATLSTTRVLDVALSGDYLFLADWYGGMVVVDITNPLTPIEIGFYDTPPESHGITAIGNTVFLANGDSGLWIFDVSTPATPQLVSHIDTPGYAQAVAVDSNLAYVADRTGGLRIMQGLTPDNIDGDLDGFTVASGDCNDLDPMINPAADEICSDSIDNNCDTLIDSDDPFCAPVCVPTATREKGTTCRDNIDNDCDGLIDTLDADCASTDDTGDAGGTEGKGITSAFNGVAIATGVAGRNTVVLT